MISTIKMPIILLQKKIRLLTTLPTQPAARSTITTLSPILAILATLGYIGAEITSPVQSSFRLDGIPARQVQPVNAVAKLESELSALQQTLADLQVAYCKAP